MLDCSRFLLEQEAFQSTKNGLNQVLYLQVVPSLPSTHTLVPSPTPCSDLPNGHPPHIDETTKVAFVVSDSRGVINHSTLFLPPLSRPPRVIIATINGK